MPKQIEMKATVTIRWWRSVGEVKPEHVEALEESGWKRATEMAQEGYTSGELNDSIHMIDADPEEGVGYTGWWEMETARTNKE